jgi:hypothetical protein
MTFSQVPLNQMNIGEIEITKFKVILQVWNSLNHYSDNISFGGKTCVLLKQLEFD